MRIHEIDWSSTLPQLALYERLPPRARKELLSLQGLRYTAAAGFGDHLEGLIETGVLERLPMAGRVRLAATGRPLLVALRAAARCGVLTQVEPTVLLRYVQATFPRDLCRELLIGGVFDDDDLAGALAEAVAGAFWIPDILAPDMVDALRYAHQRCGLATPPMLDRPAQQQLAVLVDVLRERSGPIGVLDLPDILGTSDLPTIHRVLQTGLRYLVLFPGLDPEGRRLVLGLCAGARAALGRQPMPEPEPVAVPLRDVPAYGALDLHHLLVATAGGDVRVRADMHLFKRDADDLLGEFTDLDDLTRDAFAITKAERFGRALHMAQGLDWLEVVAGSDGRRRITATADGRTWLALDSQARRRSLLQHLGLSAGGPAAQGTPRRRTAREATGLAWRAACETADNFALYSIRRVDLTAAVSEELARLPREGAVPLRAFMAYAARTRNPLLDQGPYAEAIKLAWQPYQGLQAEAECEKAWSAILLSALRTVLLPWGGLRLGRVVDADGKYGELLVGLSPLGAHVLGLEAELPPPPPSRAQVIVQPNFEIVFMAPDPGAEARLAAFSERLGRGVGTLFRVTKPSVSRAAAAGMTADAILGTLERLASAAIPANVATEIAGWHARQRVLVLDRPWVLRCGDAETAARVLGVAGRFLERLSEDLLVLRSGQRPDAVAKALAPHGITVDTSHAPLQPDSKARRRKTRRW